MCYTNDVLSLLMQDLILYRTLLIYGSNIGSRTEKTVSPSGAASIDNNVAIRCLRTIKKTDGNLRNLLPSGDASHYLLVGAS